MLVRNPAPAAQALQQAGAALVVGDLEVPSPLAYAVTGADAVFSVQPAPGPGHADLERRQAGGLVAAARTANVRRFIQTSVSDAGDFRTMAGWADGRWERNYGESKADVEGAVRAVAFPVHTILRPALMMDDFAAPKASWMFPDLARREIPTAVAPDTRIPFVAAADVAAATLLALDDPARLDGAAIELAGDRLSLAEAAAILGHAKAVTIVARTPPPEELVARGHHPGWVESQRWQTVVGYPARPATMVSLGLVPTTLADRAAAHVDSIDIG